MSETVIRVESLYKQYRLGTINHGTLRQDLQSWWARMRGKEDPNAIVSMERSSSIVIANERFWALKDISFDVSHGEILGIIGRNGAGKSTLLKILSRVTTPTRGTAKIKGKVASLLEVGTGFHQELTGRENIFLNGAIFGLRKQEIKKKFDEIVAFAEIGKFIDTPVKRYSSGMYVRLAFAVAAHLEPEILIIDEVLAVGDIQFQKKCLGKMKDVKEKGRTILFVSHNMDAISALCSRAIVLSDGIITYEGEVTEAISTYKKRMISDHLSVKNSTSRGGSGGIKITDVWLSNESDERIKHTAPGRPVFLNMEASILPLYQNGKNISVGFGIDNSDERRLFTTVSSWEHNDIITKGEKVTVRCHIPYLPLIPGRYLISASVIYQMDTIDALVHCASVDIIEENTSYFINRTKDQGNLCIPCKFDYSVSDHEHFKFNKSTGK